MAGSQTEVAERRDAKDQEGGRTFDQLEDKNQKVVITNDRSEMDRCNQGLEDKELEYKQRIHQLGDTNTLKGQESKNGHKTGRNVSKHCDSSQEEVHQLEEHTPEVNHELQNINRRCKHGGASCCGSRADGGDVC